VAGTKPQKGKRGFEAEVGYGAGALQLGGGYGFTFRNLNLVAGLSYGIGNSYSVMNAGLSAVFPFGDSFAGAQLGMTNYSARVADILGVSGNIEQGSRAGFGVFFGRPMSVPKIGKIAVKFGYNTAMGITLVGVYKF